MKKMLFCVLIAAAAPAAAQMSMSHDDMAAPKTPMLLEGYGNGGFKAIRK